MTRTQILPEILKLSGEDQIMIVEAIRNHLAGKVAPVDEVEFKAELDRRVADADANPEDQCMWQDVVGRRAGRR